MTKQFNFQSQSLFRKIKIISNPARFMILEMTKDKPMTVSDIGDKLKLKYKRCSEYIRMMEKEGMITKDKEGRSVLIKSTIQIKENSIIF